MQIKIVDASWHRNGVAGEGFYAVLFDADQGRMVASLFGDDVEKVTGRCAVYRVHDLVDANIKFAHGNSWRGDAYEAALRPALKAWLEENGTNKVGPFSL